MNDTPKDTTNEKAREVAALSPEGEAAPVAYITRKAFDDLQSKPDEPRTVTMIRRPVGPTDMPRVALYASPPFAPAGVEEAWQELCERDDRTSPEEYPDMCLITRDELAAFMSRSSLQPDTQAVDASGSVTLTRQQIDGLLRAAYPSSAPMMELAGWQRRAKTNGVDWGQWEPAGKMSFDHADSETGVQLGLVEYREVFALTLPKLGTKSTREALASTPAPIERSSDKSDSAGSGAGVNYSPRQP